MPVLAAAYGASNIVCLIHDRWHDQDKRPGRKLLEQLGIACLPVDLVSGRGLDRIPRSPDMILHLAANTDTGSADHTVNDRGIRNLLEALGPLPQGFQFIFTSSVAVSDHSADPGKPVNEETELLRPFNDYGRRKLAAEKYLREQAAMRNFQATIIRLGAIHGPGRLGLYDTLSRLAARDALMARLNYPGKISLIGVDDVVQVIISASKRRMSPGTSDLFIPVAEVATIQDLLERYYQAHGIAYRPISLPKFFWRTCDLLARIGCWLEPVLPHVIANRIWQAGLLFGNGLATVSDKTQRTFPNLRMGRIMEAITVTGSYNGLEKG